MTRYFAPLVCFVLAAYIYSTIGGDGPVLVFVGLDRLVGRDPVAQSMLTVEILVALGTAFLLFAVLRHRRDRARDRAEDAEDDDEG